jgi:hypothetical protein
MGHPEAMKAHIGNLQLFLTWQPRAPVFPEAGHPDNSGFWPLEHISNTQHKLFYNGEEGERGVLAPKLWRSNPKMHLWLPATVKYGRKFNAQMDL